MRIVFRRTDDVTVRSLSQRFPNGAPRRFEDTVSLGRGRYLVHALLIDGDGEARAALTGVELPPEGDKLRVNLTTRGAALLEQ